MSEISSWSETAANNNSATPNGWPEGQLPATVNDCAREMMAATAREYNRSHVTISSTGSANAYVLTYTTAPTYTHGLRVSFKANFTNTGAATVNVNSLGAKTIVRLNGSTTLSANDIVSDQHVHLEYDSALDKMIMLTVPGTTVTTGANTFTADQTITAGALNTARATVASAATTADIWAADGNQIDWTGTTTCTGFPAAPQAGVSRTLICAAAAPFTAGANMLIDGTASGDTLTCAANDIVIVHAVTTTQFRLSHHPYAGNNLRLLQTVTASASATVDLTAFSSAYDSYIIRVAGVRPVTDGSSLQAQMVIGGALQTTAYYYHLDFSGSTATTYSGTAGANVPEIYIAESLDSVSGSSTADVVVNLENANNTTLYKALSWTGTVIDSSAGSVRKANGSGGNQNSSGAVSTVRFKMSAGNVSVGTFRLYGVTK